MAQLFANNAASKLAAAITIGGTSLTLTTGEGAKFPAITGPDNFLVTLVGGTLSTETSWEIVSVTARAGDVLTIVRAQEGTAAAAWAIATVVELRLTAATLGTKQDTLVSGTNIKTVNSSSVLGAGNLAVGDVTLAGTQTLTNKTITETVFAVTGTTPALTATNGAVQTWALTAASTPTNSLTTGQSIILVITPGAFTVTWPAGIIFTKQGGSGAAPTLFSAGKTSVVLWMVGSVLYGSHLGDTV